MLARLLVLIAVALVIRAHKIERPDGPKPCNDNPDIKSRFPPCSSTTESSTSTSTTAEDSSEEATPPPTDDSDTSTDGLSALERAHWCRFSNGTYASLNETFLHTSCSLCRCTKQRTFQCQLLQCMPTYCLDNSDPVRPQGECCTRCPSDPLSSGSCVFDGLSYPHGAVVKSLNETVQCWCYLGHIECREYSNSPFGTGSLLTDGIVVYFIAVLVVIVLLFGLIVWCACTLAIVYYYKRHQQVFQDVYHQYVAGTGWQPVEEEEEEAGEEAAVEEKHLEAEKYQYVEDTSGAVPPPYDLHNSAYLSEQK